MADQGLSSRMEEIRRQMSGAGQGADGDGGLESDRVAPWDETGKPRALGSVKSMGMGSAGSLGAHVGVGRSPSMRGLDRGSDPLLRADSLRGGAGMGGLGSLKK